jgi:hypothetical protein
MNVANSMLRKDVSESISAFALWSSGNTRFVIHLFVDASLVFSIALYDAQWCAAAWVNYFRASFSSLTVMR